MESNNQISFRLNRKIYPEESILQAASMFEEVAKTNIDELGKFFGIRLTACEKTTDEELQKLKNEFCNACLSFTND